MEGEGGGNEGSEGSAEGSGGSRGAVSGIVACIYAQVGPLVNAEDIEPHAETY